MTGVAKPRKRIGRRLKDSENDNTEIHALLRRLNAPTSTSVSNFAGGSAGGGQGTEINYLPTAGGTMVGAIAFFPKLVTIDASGVIDIGETTDNYSSRVIVSPNAGSTDDLVTISNPKHAGQLLFLQGILTNTITLKTTGNISTINDADFKLVDNDIIILQWDTTSAKWEQITVGNILGNVNTFTGTTAFTGIFSATGTQITLGDADTDSLSIVAQINTDLDPDADATYNIGSALLRWNDIYGVTGVFNTLSATTSFSSTGTTIIGDAVSDTVSFTAQVNSDFDPDGDATRDMGTAILRWNNIYGVTGVYNTLSASTSFSSTGTTTLGDATSDNIACLARFTTDLDPDADATYSLGSAVLRWNDIYGTTGVFNTLSATTSFSSTGTTTLGDADTDVTNLVGYVVVQDRAATGLGTPAAATEYIFLDSATGELSVKKPDTSVVSLEGSGGEVTVWTADHDANGNDWIFDLDGDSAVVTNVDDTFKLKLGGTEHYTFSSATMDVSSANILNTGDIRSQTDLTYNIGTTTNAYANVYSKKVVFDNTDSYINYDSVSGDLFFNVATGKDMWFEEASTTFWQLDGLNNICVFHRDIELTAGEAIRANSATEIGYFVTNSSASVGTEGTIELPFTTSSVANKTAADGLFGAVNGAIGVYEAEGSSTNIFIRQNDGNWTQITVGSSTISGTIDGLT